MLRTIGTKDSHMLNYENPCPLRVPFPSQLPAASPPPSNIPTKIVPVTTIKSRPDFVGQIYITKSVI